MVYDEGLDRLTLTSRKPSAKECQPWVVHKVLPSLRAHGRYPPPKDSKSRRKECARLGRDRLLIAVRQQGVGARMG